MNISIKSTLGVGNQSAEVETKALHYRHDILGLKFRNSTLNRLSDSLDDEPTSVCRDIKGFTTHGTSGIWSGTTLLPAV